MRDGISGSLPLLLESVTERPGNLVDLGNDARALLACTMLLDADDAGAGQWLRLLCRCYTLQAARTVPGDGPVTLDLPLLGPTTAPRRAGSTKVLALRTYVDACHAAYALEDSEAGEALCRVPVDSIEEEPPRYQLLHARSLQALMLQDTRAAARLAVEALTACNDDTLPLDVRRYALGVVSPEIELMTAWGEPAGEWDCRVRNAVESNRQYAMWEGGGAPVVAAYVMLGALAFAAVRNAAGLPSTPAAPELPRGLIYRSYAGLGSNPRTGG